MAKFERSEASLERCGMAANLGTSMHAKTDRSMTTIKSSTIVNAFCFEIVGTGKMIGDRKPLPNWHLYRDFISVHVNKAKTFPFSRSIRMVICSDDLLFLGKLCN